MPGLTAPDGLDFNSHPQLFLVRVWCEDLGQGRLEWRGRVQHIGSGEVRYFHDWLPLIACLQEMVSDSSDHMRGI